MYMNSSYENYDDLAGFFSRIKRVVRKVVPLPTKIVRKIVPLQRKIAPLKPSRVKRLVAKVTPIETKIRRSKIARKIVAQHKQASKKIIKAAKTLTLMELKVMGKISPVHRRLYQTRMMKLRMKDLFGELQRVRDQLLVKDTPELRAREREIVDELKVLGKKYAKELKRMKIVVTIAAVVASVFTAGAAAPAAVGFLAALKAGAIVLAKKLALEVVSGLVQQGLSKEQAHATMTTMLRYPPNPSITDPAAAVQDSFARQADAEERRAEAGVQIRGFAKKWGPILGVGVSMFSLMR